MANVLANSRCTALSKASSTTVKPKSKTTSDINKWFCLVFFTSSSEKLIHVAANPKINTINLLCTWMKEP